MYIITHKKKYIFFIFLLILFILSCKIKTIHHHLEFMEIVCKVFCVTPASQSKKMQLCMKGGLRCSILSSQETFLVTDSYWMDLTSS